MLRRTMQINTSGGPSDATATFPGPLFVDENKSPSAKNLQRSAGESPEESSSEPPTVLLVDDNETVLSRAKAALSARCVVLGTARDGHAALEAAAALTPAVIVLDISMPGMNGFELARRLRAAGSTARLVFLTVHDEEELILAAGNAGAIGYVLKSRLSADLVVAVCEARAGRPFQSLRYS
jgi:DNA-binding NarL/FixJ family response regulator